MKPAPGEKAAMIDQETRLTLQHSSELEATRIAFLETSRGRDAALEFARQTRNSYRRAVVTHTAPAGDRIFRLRLIGSYCYLKRYIATA